MVELEFRPWELVRIEAARGNRVVATARTLGITRLPFSSQTSSAPAIRLPACGLTLAGMETGFPYAPSSATATCGSPFTVSRKETVGAGRSRALGEVMGTVA